LATADQKRSDDRRLPHLLKVTSERIARLRGELDEHAAAIIGIRAAQVRLGRWHQLQPEIDPKWLGLPPLD
jgi:hypothetical protein